MSKLYASVYKNLKIEKHEMYTTNPPPAGVCVHLTRLGTNPA